MTDQEIQQLLEKQNKYISKLEQRIQVLENPPKPVESVIPSYDILRAYKFYYYINGKFTLLTGLAGTKVYYVSDTSGGAVTRKLTFTNGILTKET